MVRTKQKSDHYARLTIWYFDIDESIWRVGVLMLVRRAINKRAPRRKPAEMRRLALSMRLTIYQQHVLLAN